MSEITEAAREAAEKIRTLVSPAFWWAQRPPAVHEEAVQIIQSAIDAAVDKALTLPGCKVCGGSIECALMAQGAELEQVSQQLTQDVDGNSYCVPSSVTLVEQLKNQLNAAWAEVERLTWCAKVADNEKRDRMAAEKAREELEGVVEQCRNYIKRVTDHLDGCSHGYPYELWDATTTLLARIEGRKS